MRRTLLVVSLAACLPRGTPAPTGGGSAGIVAYTDTAIAGAAELPVQHVSEPSVKGKVTDLAAHADGDRQRWNLVLEDNADLGHSYAIELPPAIAPALATGKGVTDAAEITGDGPDARGHLVVTDEQGALVIALGALPAGWTVAAAATRVTGTGAAPTGSASSASSASSATSAMSATSASSATSGTSASSATSASAVTRVTAPDGTAVELVAAPWRSFALAGAKYVGVAASAADYALVRVR